MKVNYNISAIIANNTLGLNDRNLSASTERLSSGYKINHGKDNPAGLAMAKRMNSQIRGLSQASQSASDGISVVETAEGALAEVHDMLQRMNELAIKSANGTMAEGDRKMVQEEADQLKEEIIRIANTTEFNGKNLLGGDCDLKGYSDDESIKVRYYADEVSPGHYGINITNAVLDDDGNIEQDTFEAGLGDGNYPDNCTITTDGNKIIIKNDDTFEVKLQLTQSITLANPGDPAKSIDLNLTGIGAMVMQIGANEGQVLEVRIPTISLDDMGIEDLDLMTQDDATEGIDKIKGAIDYVSSVRSRLGAYQNRLEHSVASLDITHENMTGAYSRLMDVDMSTEMIEYTKNQVLVQSSTSMLAQANERPSQILQLLQ